MADVVVFANAGEVDVKALTVLGASVKEGDAPIGFFGTGFKYALSVILRAGGRVVVYSGLERHTFSARPEVIRGEEFDIVHLDGRSLSFTTQLGRNWQMWMAYRELHSNMLDEDGEVDVVRGMPREGVAGTTLVCIECDEFLRTYNERHTIVLETTPAYNVPGYAEAHPSVGADPIRHVFYRGMRAMELDKPALYRWNMKRNLTLTEDRVVKDQYYVPAIVVHALWSSTDESLIEEVLTCSSEMWEHGLDFSMANWWGAPGETFLNVVESLQRDTGRRINVSALTALGRARKADRPYIDPDKLDTIMREDLAASIDMLERHGIDVRSYPIRVTETLGENVLGLAEKRTIWVSKRAFTMGRRTVMGTLYEEWLHIRHGYVDETRSMQNHLIDTIMHFMESAEKHRRDGDTAAILLTDEDLQKLAAGPNVSLAAAARDLLGEDADREESASA